MPLDMATEPPPPEGFAPEAMEEEFRALREDLRCYAVLASKLFYSANAVRIYSIKLTAARSSNNPNAISKQRNYTDASVLLLDVPLFRDRLLLQDCSVTFAVKEGLSKTEGPAVIAAGVGNSR